LKFLAFWDHFGFLGQFRLFGKILDFM
jgi:hypothetical protein